MRDTLKVGLGLLLLAGAAAPVAAQTPTGQSALKIGYIDSQRIIAEAPGSREAARSFEQEMARYQGELEQMENELKQMLEQYERQQVTLSPDARRQRQEDIRSRQIAYQQRATELEQEAARRQAELVEPIMARINTVLQQIQAAEGYTLIFDSAAGALVAADPALNLTDMVLTRLRDSAPGR